jgi:outer membrane protein assembly factor BamA
MKHAWLGCLLLGGLLFAGTQDSDINVNTRYTVDTVTVAGKGWKTDLVSDQNQNQRLSSGLRKDLAALIGQKLNPSALDELATRLKKELAAREVSHHVLRGDSPEHVRVEFEVKPYRGEVGASVTKFVYNSRQGWSGNGGVDVTVQQNSFRFGLVSDGDSLDERYAGISARYENRHVGSDRVDLKFQFDSFHDEWNSSTLDALGASGSKETSDAYRTRQNFQPAVSIALAKPLTLEVGANFERLGEQYPAAHTEGSNAMIATLRYHQRLEESENQQDLDASYSLGAATRILDSDFVYTSHAWGMRYQLTHGKHVVSDSFSGGVIIGRAPLDDRFVLGNSCYLRGWNKYEIDPLGGNRMVHNSVDYHYGLFRVFYDTGAIWDEGQTAVPRHSLGVGVRESVFTLAVAFPMRLGRVEPIFMMGVIP